ncbi:anti-sigma factor family protein [Amycolatopsis anabasis]|uniref:anti-sigma factor family protein n=1 Tax=Amycolatopsis anabasis TaxID=1840409 RepID=UPI00131EB07E|nr:anti-sigma factor [Amycolatopsis anabasis]
MTRQVEDPFAHQDAAYVLGALSPEDRAAFEQHLRECPDCARSVQELAGLPGLLGQVTPEMVAPEEPSPDLLPSLLGRIRKARLRQRMALAGTGIVALAASAAAVVALLAGPGGADHPGTPMVPLGAYPVQASAQLGSAPGGGTLVDMSCSYRGAQGGEYEYVLVAVRRDGGAAELATWRAIPENTAHISVGTAMARADIQALEVRTLAGKPLLRWNP